MVLSLALACTDYQPADGKPGDSTSPDTQADADTDTDGDTDTDSDADTDTDTTVVPPEPVSLVLLITEDAFTRHFHGTDEYSIGAQYGWDVTPFTDTFFSEGVLLPNVVMARALTGVSLATMLTGAYPRNHGVRDNTDEAIFLPTLQEQFQAAGWTTAAIISNRCIYATDLPGWDFQQCNYEDSLDDSSDRLQQQRAEDDDVATLKTLLTEHAGEKMFVWMHFINPHDKLETVDPWMQEFHPDTYKGELNPYYRSSLDSVTLGETDYDDEDRRYVNAVYASAVRANDTRFEDMMGWLKDQDLYDNAVIVMGADHGDELNMRPDNPYFWHGCTYYNVAAVTTWFFKAPNLAPGVIPEYQAEVDIAPTILDLADVDRDVLEPDGVSIMAELEDLEDPAHDAFLERSARTAAVVSGRYKYVMNPDGNFFQCTPFTPKFTYITPAVELYDLVRDPYETDNLSEREPKIVDELRGKLCTYILEDQWSNKKEEDATNPIVRRCLEDPGGTDP